MATPRFSMDKHSKWYQDFVHTMAHDYHPQENMMETIKNSQTIGRIRMGMANNPGHTAVLAPLAVQHAVANGLLTQEDIDKALADTIKAKEDAIHLQRIEEREFNREQTRVKALINDRLSDIRAKAGIASIDAAKGVDYTYSRKLVFEIQDLAQDLITTICDGEVDGVITYTISGE